MNTVKNFTTIHLQLNQIDALEVVILLMNDFSNKVCVPNKTEDLNFDLLNIIAGIYEPENINKTFAVEMEM